MTAEQAEKILEAACRKCEGPSLCHDDGEMEEYCSKCEIEKTVKEAVEPELKACPFCGAEVKYEEREARAVKGRPVMKLWVHPAGDCILAGLELTKEEHSAWNRRASPEIHELICSLFRPPHPFRKTHVLIIPEGNYGNNVKSKAVEDA